MVSNTLTLESWKVRNLRPELESLMNFGSFFTFWGQNQLFRSYFCLSIASIIVSKLISGYFSCFRAKIVGFLAILDLKCHNVVKLARETCFTTLYFSVSGRVRELVGEIKYAFGQSGWSWLSASNVVTFCHSSCCSAYWHW